MNSWKTCALAVGGLKSVEGLLRALRHDDPGTRAEAALMAFKDPAVQAALIKATEDSSPTEAIHFHGGEARASRDRFFALTEREQGTVIEFLKTLQVVPDGSARVVSEARR